MMIGETTLSGDYLVNYGFIPNVNAQRTSVIIELQVMSEVHT